QEKVAPGTSLERITSADWLSEQMICSGMEKSMAGAGCTVTANSNSPPVQSPDNGVILYSTDVGLLLLFIRVWFREAFGLLSSVAPVTSPSVTAVQEYSQPGWWPTGVNTKEFPLQTSSCASSMKGDGLTIMVYNAGMTLHSPCSDELIIAE